MKKTSDTDILGVLWHRSGRSHIFWSSSKVDDTTRAGMLKTLEEKLKSFYCGMYSQIKVGI